MKLKKSLFFAFFLQNSCILQKKAVPLHPNLDCVLRSGIAAVEDYVLGTTCWQSLRDVDERQAAVDEPSAVSQLRC